MEPDIRKIKELRAEIVAIIDKWRSDTDAWPVVAGLCTMRDGLDAHLEYRRTGKAKGPGDTTVTRLAWPR